MAAPSTTMEKAHATAPPRHATQGALGDYSDVARHVVPLGTFVSMYASAGGMDIGFALAGFAPVWVNELNPDAAASNELEFRRLRESRPHLGQQTWPLHVGNLLAIPAEDLPARGAADLVVGGPPCQGFSVAGKMDPADERSEQVFHFLDMVDRVRPRAFVLENVKALLVNERWAATRERLAARAEGLGYSAQFFLANASHFGVPQARERMLFIGVRGGTPIGPQAATEDSPPTVRHALAQLPPIGQPGNHTTCQAKITPAKAPILRRSPFAGMLFNGAGRPLHADAPALTLPASMGGNATPIVDQEQLDHQAEPWIVEYHAQIWDGGSARCPIPKRMRRISVQEAAAIQTFPLGMQWQGPQSSQYRQIGNAVPPRLALAVAEGIKQSLGLL